MACHISGSLFVASFAGMGFRPMPDVESTLVKFQQGEPKTYEKYINHIQDFIDGEYMHPWNCTSCQKLVTVKDSYWPFALILCKNFTHTLQIKYW